MADQVLNLEFLWLPKEEDLVEINNILESRSENTFRPKGPLLKLKSVISNFCGFPVYVKDCKKRVEFLDANDQETQKRSNTEHALFYLEFFFNVFCTVTLEKNPQDDLRRFINFFCSVKHGKLASELYLKFSSSIFDVKSSIITENKARDVLRFSLGNLVGLNTFNARFDSKTSVKNDGFKITQNRLVLLHDYKKMILYFVVGKICSVKKRNATTHHLFRLEVLYASFHSVIISKNEGLTVYIRLLQAPLMYSVIQGEDELNDYTSFHDLWYTTPWFRAIDLYEGNPSYLRKEFTMNSVLRLDFKNDEYDFLFELMTHCKSIQIFFAPVAVINSTVPPVQLQFELKDFDCFYALQCLLTHNFEISDQLIVKGNMDIVQKFLQNKSKENPVALCEAMYLIFEAIIKGNVVIFEDCLKLLYERLKLKTSNAIEEDSSGKDPRLAHLLLIKRAILSPTHVLLLPPQPTLKSRTLRDCDSSYALRLSIKDVNLDTLNYTIRGFGHDTGKKQTDFFNTYMRHPLLNGVNIGNRCYKFIGSSTSQLKSHGLWFYAKDTQQRTADDLRKAVGDLHEIQIVPKYMARMGQTFSQSLGNILVPQELTNVKEPEDDIEGGIKQYLDLEIAKNNRTKYLLVVNEAQEENEEETTPEQKVEKATLDTEKKPEQYTFSDGVGRISLEQAEEVYKALDVEESRPSAMQIRYAGCKGMLVVDPTLKGKQILFRKSMRKFNSDHNSLEILKFSEKRCAFLNRPFITILEGLGIEKEVFLQLQKEMIQNHITSMFHESEACQFLNRHSLLRFNFLPMHFAGICFTEDPLFRSMIYALFQKQIGLLKNKANIEIPVNKGRTMFGVMDDTRHIRDDGTLEYGTLEYGQVFVQYSDWETDEPIIVKGTVVVTKNPCMHPGDVRKFEAIDVEGLHHIVDCIVFPAKGPRPHPDEMAGSDLDGDEYHVMWLDELTFPQENEEPMHFATKKEEATEKKKATEKEKAMEKQGGTSKKMKDKVTENKDPTKKKEATTEESNGKVTVADQVDFLCEFIFSDKVGLIAAAHLAWADQKPDSIKSDICIRLAKQYSIALDFAKSGKKVVHSFEDRPKRVPDFTQKLDEKRTYLSTRALGHLFRSCKRLELGLETERNEIDYKIDNALVHESWNTKYKKSATRVYKKYCERIEYFIRTYGFENEGQLLAGALINPPKYYENRHDLSNLMALLEFEVQWIFKDLERKFFSEFGGKPKDGVYTDAMMQKASAWYMVSYSKSERVGSQFFGLPWAVADVLVELKIKNKGLSEVKKVPSKSILEQIVDKSVSKHFPQLGPEDDSNVIHENRLAVLDVSLKILSRWVKSQRDFFSDLDFKKVEKCIGKDFDQITLDITTCEVRYIDLLKEKGNIKKAISPCYQVIETLLHIAKIGAQNSLSQLSDVRQEVGLLAWMTLIKLACTYNPQYLGIPNVAGQYARTVFFKPQDNIIDTLQLLLFDQKDEANKAFSKAVTHHYEKVKNYFKQQTKIKDLDFRFVWQKEQYVRITVEGTRYSIERLKDIVVMDDFFKAFLSLLKEWGS